MGYRGQEVLRTDFSGGQNSNSPKSTLLENEAVIAKNLIVLPHGKGIRQRQGDTEFNSTAMNSGADVQGLHYYRQADGDEWLVAIAGDKIFKSDSLDGTMDDISAALTITANQDKIWTPFTAEDESIWVGGGDAPIKWTGTGNAQVLGGSPPSGQSGFYHNNRAFIIEDTLSRINWSVLADIEDWSATGSGSHDILTKDGTKLLRGVPLNADLVLLFKENSVHQMITRSAPFPVFELFRGIGSVGINSAVKVDDLVFFITNANGKARMVATDGRRILRKETFPRLHNIDDQWDLLRASRLKYIYGQLYQGIDFRHIHWHVSSGSSQDTNNRVFVWDVDNRCWLDWTDGFPTNVSTVTLDGTKYDGGHDGKIYKKDVASVYNDASNSSGAIDGEWASGFDGYGSYETIKTVNRINIDMKDQSAGDLAVSVGADYQSGLLTNSINMQAAGALWDEAVWDTDFWGGQSDIIKNAIEESVRGNNIQVSLKNSVKDETFRINGYSVSGKIHGRKEFTSN